MKQYRKRPTTVWAEKFVGPASVDWDAVPPPAPEGVMWGPKPINSHDHYPYVRTTHGQQTWVEPGDWIIREPDGKGHYPCKDDIFLVSYLDKEMAEKADDLTLDHWRQECTRLQGLLKLAGDLESANRKMLAQEFDDICWLDVYREIGVLLGIPYNPKLLPKEKFLGNCSRYFDCMAAGKTEEYKSETDRVNGEAASQLMDEGPVCTCNAGPNDCGHHPDCPVRTAKE